MVHVVVEGKGLTVREVVAVAREGASVSLSPDARSKIAAASGFVESLLERDRPVYGVTTGFGKFADVVISPRDGGTAAQPASIPCKRSRRGAA